MIFLLDFIIHNYFIEKIDYWVWIKNKFIIILSLGGKTYFTQGGVNQYYDIGNPHKNTEANLMAVEREGYYGWVGFGGSVMQWHPELNIGFGYVPSLLEWYEFNNHKGANLQQLVVKCAKATSTQPRDSF